MKSPYLDGSVTESPIALILTESGAKRDAMTTSFFSEAAHHPTTLWVSINRLSLTHELIRESGQFTLALLHEGQKGLAIRCCAASGRERDKCGALDLYRNPEGFLLLDAALASVACRVRSSHGLGDFTLFVADIISAESETRSSVRRHLLTSDLH